LNDLQPSPSRRPSRRQREQTAYRLIVTSGVAGAVAILTGVLAIVGVMSWFFPIVAAIVAVAAALMFRRSVSR
jgi:fatty acid desaturase